MRLCVACLRKRIARMGYKTHAHMLLYIWVIANWKIIFSNAKRTEWGNWACGCKPRYARGGARALRSLKKGFALFMGYAQTRPPLLARSKGLRPLATPLSPPPFYKRQAVCYGATGRRGTPSRKLEIWPLTAHKICVVVQSSPPTLFTTIVRAGAPPNEYFVQFSALTGSGVSPPRKTRTPYGGAHDGARLFPRGRVLTNQNGTPKGVPF